jgi:hypothetical protein
VKISPRCSREKGQLLEEFRSQLASTAVLCVRSMVALETAQAMVLLCLKSFLRVLLEISSEIAISAF